MKIKYLLFVFLVVIFTGGLLAEWNGTFYVVVKQGDPCGTPSWTGQVACKQSTGEIDFQNYNGYQTYTFYMDADDDGWAYGKVGVVNWNNDPPNCGDIDTIWWSTPPNPATKTIELTTYLGY